MILIDSVYVNDSGGKMLLDYLVEQIERRNLNVFYLFDKRIEDAYPEISTHRKKYLEASTLSRVKFYLRNRRRFHKVLCFGNIPPPLRLEAEVFTYFHYGPILEMHNGYRGRTKALILIKAKFIRWLKLNTDYFVVQTKHSAMRLKAAMSSADTKILCVPFYNESRIYRDVTIHREKKYLYVSTGTTHKNHDYLLDVWELLYASGYNFPLILTIPNSFERLITRIGTLKSKGLLIENKWIDSDQELRRVYNEAEYFVFPSLAESFGLGLLEAVDAHNKVIASDLPYVYDVITPSLTFDPYNKLDLFEKILFSMNNELPPSRKNTTNNIVELINLLSSAE